MWQGPPDARNGANHRPRLRLSFTTLEKQREDALAYKDNLRQQGLAITRASIRTQAEAVYPPTPMAWERKDEDSDSPYADSDGAPESERGGLLAPGYNSPGAADSADEFEHHVHGPAGGMRVSTYQPLTSTRPTPPHDHPSKRHRPPRLRHPPNHQQPSPHPRPSW